MYTAENERGKTAFLCLPFLAQGDNQSRVLWSAASKDVLKNDHNTIGFGYRGSLRSGAKRSQSLGMMYWAAPSPQLRLSLRCSQSSFSWVRSFFASLHFCFPVMATFPCPLACLHLQPTSVLYLHLSSVDWITRPASTAEISEQLCTTKEKVFTSSLNLFSSARSVLKTNKQKNKSTQPFQLCLLHSEVQRAQCYLTEQRGGHPPYPNVYIFINLHTTFLSGHVQSLNTSQFYPSPVQSPLDYPSRSSRHSHLSSL